MKVLLIDDNPDDRALALRVLEKDLPGIGALEIPDAASLDRALEEGGFGAVITDYHLRWSDGLAVLARVKERYPECPVVMFTGTGTEEVAVEAMKSGLDDYIVKAPHHYVRLPAALRSALARAAERRYTASLENRLHSLLDRLDLGVFRASAEGRLLECNSAFLRLLGAASIQEAAARDLTSLLPGPGAEAAAAGRELRREDGAWFLVSHIPGRDAEGRPVVDGLVEDITPRKQGEEERAHLLAREREARAAAEAASLMKDEFLATLSHELRTPLNAVIGWSRLLRSGAMTGEKLQRAVETIERNAQAQARLIEDLLDVSAIVSGKMNLDVGPVDLARVTESALEAVRPAAEAKGIQVERALDPSVGFVQGDPGRLQQVVWNLLSNAVKFTPAGGRVRVELTREPSLARLTVSDTGIGIDPAVLPGVFEPFRQADSGTTRVYGGLGLGLSIVRRLVELHGGTVFGESRGAGQGATFVVELPLQVRDPGRRSTDGQPPASGLECPPELRNLRVLVVDDQADARELMAAVLEECGAEVLAVASAQEARKVFAERPPDVLVSDIAMAEEDGYELIRWVRNLPPERGGKLPAAAITAYARSEDRRMALLAGFNLFLSKPFDPNELAAVVASLGNRLRR